MTDLKPCPFCGGEALLMRPAYLKLDGENYVTCGTEYQFALAFYDDPEGVETHFHQGRGIVCKNCLANLPELDADHPDELAESWNDRK